MTKAVTFSILALASISALAHDMFLVVPDHDLPESSNVTVSLYNGTFDKSENPIDRDRMIDVSVVGGSGEASHPGADQWREDGNITLLDFTTGAAGTYVVGVSTRAKMIDLSAGDFNEYLRHDGILDVLEERKILDIMDQPATERYSKHIKTILTVGGGSSDSFSHRLGYPIEIVPLADPNTLSAGARLEILVLAEGRPAAGQLLYASYEGYHSHDKSGAHREAVQTRTDDAGKAVIELDKSGRWYVRLIRMLPVDEEGVDYESNWASLTFEILE